MRALLASPGGCGRGGGTSRVVWALCGECGWGRGGEGVCLGKGLDENSVYERWSDCVLKMVGVKYRTRRILYNRLPSASV